MPTERPSDTSQPSQPDASGSVASDAFGVVAPAYAIEIVGLRKNYGDLAALDGIDLDIEPGEFLVLLGPSGCGKSTLLKIIAGLEDATSGEVYIDSRLANYLRPRDRDVAMVFQNYALYPHMTVGVNIGFPLKMRKVPKFEVRARVAEVAELLGLSALLARYPDELSGGQRQRVALGRAIIREPVAFLMDEPLSNLDALLRVQMRTELLKLHRRVGRTTVYVTHDQVEAMTMADRIVVMHDGYIQQVGRPGDVYAHPATTFVATFVGSPPMNLLGGRIAHGTDGPMFDGPVTVPLAAAARALEGAAEVTLGIRPEHVELAPADDPAGLHASVELVEHVGPDSYLSVGLGHDVTAIVRVPADAGIVEGDQVRLRFPVERQRLFDGDGYRIPLDIDH